MKRNGWKQVMLGLLLAALFCVPAFAEISAAAPAAGESYRIIKVYQMDGVVTVIDKDGKYKTTYKGMNLTSGDTVKTGKDSHLYLQIDNDKYLMAEPGTVFTLEASGTAKDSRTQIELKTGAVLSRLDEKLNQNSSYEIKTSNATMAIRGTLTRQEVTNNPDGSTNLNADLYEGGMTVIPTEKENSGTADAGQTQLALKPQLLKMGESLNLNVDASGEVKMTESAVDFTKLSSETISFLVEAGKAGRVYTVSLEDLEKLKIEIEEKEKAAETAKKTSGTSSDSDSDDKVDKSDWEKDEKPESDGTAEELPDFE